jgi:hypothetical protein
MEETFQLYLGLHVSPAYMAGAPDRQMQPQASKVIMCNLNFWNFVAQFSICLLMNQL